MQGLLEPYNHDGTVGVAKIVDGSIENIPSTDLWNKKQYSDNESKPFLRLCTEYRWPLPNKIGEKSNEALKLSEIHTRIGLCLRKYLWISDDNTYDLIANWIISTYFRGQFKSLPILIFDGVTISGKSTALKILSELVYRGELVTNASAPAIAREIMDWGTTILIDEALDNLTSDRGNEIYNMIKSCFDRNGMWIRADPKGRNNYKYETYTNMALSIKGACLPEDIYNRSIRINMTSMPDNIELEDVENCDEDNEVGEDSPVSIRTALYTLMATSIAFPDHKNAINFKEAIQETRLQLTTKMPDGRWQYAYVLDMPKDSPQIRNRDRKIASTLYSIGLKTSSEKAIIEMIIKNNELNNMIQGDTPEALTFIALMEIFNEKTVPLYASKLDKTMFIMIMEEISTTEIADRFNDILHSQGNATKDLVITKAVTAKLSALGLAYKRGKGNRSFMDARTPDFIQNFLMSASKYTPKELMKFKEIMNK